MSYLDQLKKSRQSSFKALEDQLTKIKSGGFGNDDANQWKLDVDKAGNGYAVIRFLPPKEGETARFAQIWDHGFQGPGGWYIENSLTTINQPDPVSEYNSQLWNSGVDANKEIARKQKRRLSYFSNILVIKDPAHPENEGKVFLFKYGKKIFDKINEAMFPQYADEQKFDPFDIWGGANFKLKARNGDGGFRTYEASAFDSCEPLEMDDDKLEAVLNSMYSLDELVAPNNFKSYDELKAKLYKVLGLDGGIRAPKNSAEDDEAEIAFARAPKERAAAPTPQKQSPLERGFSDDDDDDLAFFKELAEE